MDDGLPSFININVHHLCNLDCPMCRSNLGKSEIADAEEILRYFDSLANWLPRPRVVHLTGGEAILHPRIYDFVQRLSSLGFFPVLNTNGAALHAENLRRLVDAGLGRVNVSLDGLGETHDRMRNAPGLFRGVVDILEYMSKATDLEICIVSVISALNAHTLPEMLCLLSKNERIMNFNFQAIVPTLSQPWSWDFFSASTLWPRTMEEKGEVFSAMDHIGRLRDEGLPVNNPPSQFSLWRRYFADPRSVFAERTCRVDADSLQVYPDGAVGFCNRFPRLGTILDDPERLWTSETNNVARAEMRRCAQPCIYFINCCFRDE